MMYSLFWPLPSNNSMFCCGSTIYSYSLSNMMSGLNIRIVTFDSRKIINLFRLRCFSSLSSGTDDNVIAPYESQDDDVSVNCNKSGLLQQHRNMLYEERPYKEPSSWIHQTEKYQRKVFARYGSGSGIDPRICFPKLSDKALQDHFQMMVEPETLQNMVKRARLHKEEKVEALRKREEDVGKNLEKLEQWKKELRNRALKKEADAIATRERKERLVEEVRRHFGYKVDPRDERFKEVLEQKEREDKKKQREAKRQAKEQKLVSKLVGTSV